MSYRVQYITNVILCMLKICLTIEESHHFFSLVWIMIHQLFQSVNLDHASLIQTFKFCYLVWSGSDHEQLWK